MKIKKNGNANDLSSIARGATASLCSLGRLGFLNELLKSGFINSAIKSFNKINQPVKRAVHLRPSLIFWLVGFL